MKRIEVINEGSYIRVVDDENPSPRTPDVFREFLNSEGHEFVSVVSDMDAKDVTFRLSDGDRTVSIVVFLEQYGYRSVKSGVNEWNQEEIDKIYALYKNLECAVSYFGDKIREMISDERENYLLIKKFFDERKRNEVQ